MPFIKELLPVTLYTAKIFPSRWTTALYNARFQLLIFVTTGPPFPNVGSRLPDWALTQKTAAEIRTATTNNFRKLSLFHFIVS